MEQNTQAPNPHISLKDRYDLVIKARNFHYDNFSKWMSYFYVIIAALFIALYNIIGKTGELYNSLTLIICLLGFIFSLLWHWANKGYYYWAVHFISLVNHYEKNLLKLDEKERVYFVFADKGLNENAYNPITGANFSTSKISLLVSYIVCIVWSWGFMWILLYPSIKNWVFLCFLFSFLIIGALSWVGKKYLYSNIRQMPDLNKILNEQ